MEWIKIYYRNLCNLKECLEDLLHDPHHALLLRGLWIWNDFVWVIHRGCLLELRIFPPLYQRQVMRTSLSTSISL